MAGSILKLTVDRQNKKLVAFNGSVASLPDQFQSNIVTLQVQIVDPAASTLANPTIFDAGAAGVGLRASVGSQPTGSSGGPTPLALQDTFAFDNVNKWFTGDLALNTTAIDTYIGAADQIQAWFELNLTTPNRVTVLQNKFNLKAVVDEGTSTVPTPTDQYLTMSQVLALLAQKQDKIIKSPGLVYGRELGIADDGTPTDSIGPL